MPKSCVLPSGTLSEPSQILYITKNPLIAGRGLHLLKVLRITGSCLPLFDIFLLVVDAQTSEIAILGTKFIKNDLVRLSSREFFAAEKTIHRFERDSLGFGDQEPDKHNRAQHHGGEEEVDPVGHGGEHLGSEAGDDEVLQGGPLISTCVLFKDGETQGRRRRLTQNQLFAAAKA